MGRSGRWVAVLVAAFAPPAGVIITGWPRWAAAHPVLFVLLFLAYLLIIGVLSFADGVVRQLRDRWQQRMVNWLDRMIGRRFSRFGRRYRDFLLATLRFVDLKGLATIGANTPELDEVFVNVGLAQRSPNQITGDLLADVPEEVTERRPLTEFLGGAEPAVLAVLGAPGSGKTTLLRHTARRLAADRRTVPLLLFLRDHVRQIVADPTVSLIDVLRTTLGRYREEEPPGWFAQRLDAGDCTVLLDGLDEIADDVARRAVADWVESQIGQYQRNDFVITCRPQGYLSADIAGARVLQVRSLTGEQVAAFVRGWYLAVERHSTGFTDASVTGRAEEAAHDLLDLLADAPGLRELTVNPLLLTMITNVHRYRGALPGSRAELYNEICEVMLWRRRAVKKLPGTLGGEKKELVLRVLAFAMMQRRVRDLSKEDILPVIGPALRRVSREQDAAEFLAAVLTDGMLLERANGLVAFAHHTFQEYLAAAHIRQRGKVPVLIDAVEDTWWRESTLLYAARSDADPIIRACLAANSVTALALAFDCAEEAREVDPVLRDRLEDLLASCFTDGSDADRRRLMARVLITRQLRHLLPVPGGSRITAHRVSAEVYRLFLCDTGRPLPDGDFVPGAGEPALGMDRADVPAFVGWVNGIAGEDAVYRLPRAAELADPTVRRTLSIVDEERLVPSLWVDGGGGRPELLVLAAEHPYTVTEAELVEQLVADLYADAPMLIRLLLARAVAVLRVLRHKLMHGYPDTRTLRLSDDLGVCVGRAFDLLHDAVGDAPPEQCAAVGEVLVKVFDLARSLDRAVDLSRALDLAGAHGHAESTAMHHAIALDLKLAVELVDNARSGNRQLIATLNGNLDREVQAACALAAPLAEDLEYAMTVRGAGAPDTDVPLRVPAGPPGSRSAEVSERLVALTGEVLAHAVTDALSSAERDEDGDGQRFRIEFVRAFVEKAAFVGDRVLAPVLLPTLLERVRQARVHGWAADALARLLALTEPLLTGTVRPQIAGTVRVLALCLAGELAASPGACGDVGEQAGTAGCRPGGTADRELAEAFVGLAAGVTLLQRRADGRAPVTEGIVLAVD